MMSGRSESVIPTSALDDRLAIVGCTGAGKTYAAKGLAERVIRSGARVCITDPLGVWWGLRAGADGNAASGLDVAIFGGEHADVPITEENGAALGRIVAGSDIRCIIDISELNGDASRRRFSLAFFETLYETNRQPLHLIIDEADLFAPQSPDKDGPGPALLSRVSQIARRGRHRGFIPWLITQRPAVLNKNVLSQALVLIAMQLTSSQDRDAIGAWIEGQADRETGKRILAELPRLATGDGYVWAPRRGMLERIRFPLISTFDSSATPERGEVVSATLRPVDTAAIAAELATTRTPEKREAGPSYDDGYRAGIAAGDSANAELRQELCRYQAATKAALGHLAAVIDRSGDVPVIDVLPVPEPVTIEARKKRGNGLAPTGGEIGPERRILVALAERHPARLTEAQWATLAGMKRSGGTWKTYKSRLRGAGCLVERNDLFSVTPEGMAAIGARPGRPRSAEDIRAMWKQAMGAGPARMIDVLFHETALTREQLAERVSMEPSGGSFKTYMSRLRSNGLIAERDGVVRLSAELMR